MTAIDFDTLKVSRSLRDAGVEERQAEAITDAIKQSAKIENLVTKDDLRLTKDELRSEIERLRQYLDGKLEALEHRIDARLTEKLRQPLLAQSGLMVAVAGFIIAVIKLVP